MYEKIYRKDFGMSKFFVLLLPYILAFIGKYIFTEYIENDFNILDYFLSEHICINFNKCKVANEFNLKMKNICYIINKKGII